MSKRTIVRSELVEQARDPDASETLRIFRELRRDGGTSFAHLQLDRLDTLAEALVDDAEDEVVADLRVRTFDPTDEDPDDETAEVVDDETDDLETLDRSVIESLREVGDDPPWAPVPTRIAKTYLQSNEDAQLELNFPRVYEENRSSMLADLTTAQSMGYIGHARAAIQAASELGFDDYNYDLEQQAIARQSPQGVQPGAGDEIAAGVMGPSASGQPSPAPKQVPPPSGTGADDRGTSLEPRNKRDDLSSDSQHAFRMQQKTSEMVETMLQTMLVMQQQMVTAMREMATSSPPTVLSEVRESLPPQPVVVTTPQPIILHETTLETMQDLMRQTTETLEQLRDTLPRPAPPPLPPVYRRRIERDAQGLISAIIDEPQG